jgi:hypothetical protein
MSISVNRIGLPKANRSLSESTGREWESTQERLAREWCLFMATPFSNYYVGSFEQKYTHAYMQKHKHFTHAHQYIDTYIQTYIHT